MLASPVFVRELVTAPRRSKHFVARATYVSALLMLIGTAWLVLAGSQTIRNIGDLARFGTILFQILAPLQLTLAVFFAALFTASSVAQEKDRRTLILLLMTDLSNFEVVVGKLMASMLNVLVLLLASLPLFMA
ncbi:MAG: ABC transporter permease subunit, partial [Planctomycetales bacterium]|nr:ABC transporter permease subunit [Planctomycetales bacterium]